MVSVLKSAWGFFVFSLFRCSFRSTDAVPLLSGLLWLWWRDIPFKIEIEDIASSDKSSLLLSDYLQTDGFHWSQIRDCCFHAFLQSCSAKAVRSDTVFARMRVSAFFFTPVISQKEPLKPRLQNLLSALHTVEDGWYNGTCIPYSTLVHLF